MPVNLSYSNPGGGQELLTLELVSPIIGEVLTLSFASGGGVLFHTVTTTVVLDELNLLRSAISAFKILQGADGKWQTVSTVPPLSTTLEILYSDSIGDLEIDSSADGGGDVATKIWRGDAPAVAQVTHIQALNVQSGDFFSLSINGKSIGVTATANTGANVAGLFAAAIAATTIAEWSEVAATVDGNLLVLTANTPGVPFVVTGSDTDGSGMGVVITTVRNGAPAVNMVQEFRIGISAAGTFTVTCGDQVTSAISVGASAGTVQTALQGLSTIGASNCTVTSATSADGNDTVYTCTFNGALAATNVATLIVALSTTKPIIRTTQHGAHSGVPKNEIQTIQLGDSNVIGGAAAGYTYILTIGGQSTGTLDANLPTATIKSALESLSNVDSVNVTSSGTTLIVEFTGVDGQSNQAQMTASVFSASTTVLINVPVSTTQAAAAAVNEQQLITVTGGPTGGTLTLTLGANTTSGLAWNAAAATVQTALVGLASIGAGNCTVTGAAGGPWTVDFISGKAGQDMAAMTGNGASLTGAAAESIDVTTFVGSSGPNHWDTAANWIPSGVPVNGDHVRFELGSSDCLYGLAQSAVTLASMHIAARWTGKLGLPRISESDYVEYRPTELAIGCTSLLIGHGDGSGSGKVAINTGSVQTSVEVRGSGGSSDIGIAAVTWRGTHASNVVNVLDGDFGTAPYSDQTAVVNLLTQRGGSCALKNTTLTQLIAPNQNTTAYNCTLGGQPLEL